MTPEDIELAFIREFSLAGNLIGKTVARMERRERVRQAIYAGRLINAQFYEEPMNYAEAFRVCYGERLDRRVAMREIPDHKEEKEE